MGVNNPAGVVMMSVALIDRSEKSIARTAVYYFVMSMKQSILLFNSHTVAVPR